MNQEKAIVDALVASLAEQGLRNIHVGYATSSKQRVSAESDVAMYDIDMVRLDAGYVHIETLYVDHRTDAGITEVVKYHPSGGIQIRSVEGAKAFKLEEYVEWCLNWWKD